MKHLMLTLALIFYCISCFWSVLKNGEKVSLFFLICAVTPHTLSSFCCYTASWPLIPIYRGPLFTSCVVAWMALERYRYSYVEYRLILYSATFLFCCFYFFPKDYYLPFLHSKTIFAHLFLVSGVVAKALFFVGSIDAFLFLFHDGNKENDLEYRSFATTVIIGFALWTVSMFSGEIWSYLGWGFPIVWDDPAVVGMIVVWFYYACFLHLYLTKLWTVKKRASMVILGAVITFVFSYMPELGPFRLPDLAILLHSGRL